MKRPAGIPARRWRIKDPASPEFLQEHGYLNPVLLQVLYNRGFKSPGQIQAFLEGRYTEKEDPFLLPDMDHAVARIEIARDHAETVFVYGDFDADGVTSTVLLTEALRCLGLDRKRVIPYIPDRVDEGYGLNTEALDTIKSRGGDLVITVDCGIRSVREVEHARHIGLDMILTDHHSIGYTLPPALAVINPKREDSAYPETMLAGVGIAYKLVQALAQTLPANESFTQSQLLDLVALGTVADIAPLRGENRKLVSLGLRVLNAATRPGVAALAHVAHVSPGDITAETIGFALGPRINAAGRMAHAYEAAKLLAATDHLDAARYAQKLDRLNRDRQSITRELCDQAEEMIDPAGNLLIAAGTQFPSGIVGLVAGRLAEKYYRPAIVIEQGEEESRGSCRSIEEFHITDALDEVGNMLKRYGGHAQAAGFTIANDNLPEFVERMQAIAGRELAGKELKPVIDIDADISFSLIDWALHGQLKQLEPTGEKNPTPVFVSRNCRVNAFRAVGATGDHLKLTVGDGFQELEAIAFRQGGWSKQMPRLIDLVYTIDMNEWRGQRSLQLKVIDIRPAETSPA